MDMAGSTRSGRTPLGLATEALGAEGGRYVLFQALRMMRDAARGEGAAAPELRLRHVPYLQHQGHDLHRIEHEDGAIWIEHYVLGLLGANGPMPLRMTEEAIWQRLQEHESPLADFLSVLGERHTRWFFEAWLLGRTEELAVGGDAFHANVAASLVGATEERGTAWFELLGLMLNPARGASALESLIALVARCQVQVEQLVGEWLQIPAPSLARLGRGSLGEDCTIGTRVWQRASKFRIHLRVRHFAHFADLIPGRGALGARVQRLVARFLRVGVDWDWQLALPSTEAQHAQLGQRGELGQTAWLGRPAGDTATARFANRMAPAQSRRAYA